MHFKRKGPKSTRAGCLLCKDFKREGALPRHKDMLHGNRRRSEAQRHQLRDEALGKFAK